MAGYLHRDDRGRNPSNKKGNLIMNMQIRIITATRAAHAAYLELASAQGDDTGCVWDQLLPEQRAAAIDGVTALLNEGLTDEESHNRWAKHLLASGWRRGPVKSTVHRTHPGLGPLAEIDWQLQARNMAFCETARVISKAFTLGTVIQ